MWNGVFSPSVFKVANKHPDAEVSFDAENTDDPESMDPGAVHGTMTVTGLISSGQTSSYVFNCTYQDYLDFKESGYSIAWLNEHLMDNTQGDWGWPWGRDNNVIFIENVGYRTRVQPRFTV